MTLYTEVTLTRLTPQTRREIEDFATATGTSMCSYIRALVEHDRERREEIRAAVERAAA